ncbi:MAG TPA: outer membrane protein transport protein [Vicinamibacteria bacterium]|jgi:long-subunit fatty acid transport protein
MNRRLVFAAVVGLAGPAGIASAQTTDEINGGIQFDFSLPGARSLAMGGAFVALSDDATAAYSNPAGLTTLTKPEISLEGRLWNFFSFLPHEGHAFGPPSGVGVDTVAGIVNAEVKDTATAPAFLSFVFTQPKWAIAVYRHELSSYEATIESLGPFASDTTGAFARVNPLRGDLDLDISDWGASLAYKFNDQFSLGFGVGLFDFEIGSSTSRYLLTPHLAPGQRIDVSAGQTFPGGQLGPADFSDGNTFFTNTAQGEDTAVAINTGFVWKPSSKWSVGGAFRQGPKFTFNTEFVLGPAHNRVFGSPAGFVVDEDEVFFHVPDSYAFGIAYRPSDRWTVAFEYNFVNYEQLLDGSGDGRPVEIAGLTESQDPDPALRAELRRQGENIINGLAIDNANQLRLGVEWIVSAGSTAFVLRGGSWFDPDHRVRFEGQQEIPGSALDVRLDDEFHFSAGFGVASSRFQFDAAIDISDRVNTLSASTVVRF